MSNIYSDENTNSSNPTAAYLTGLTATGKLVHRYPEDLGGGGVDSTPYVVFAPYKRKQLSMAVNPDTVLTALPTPTFNVVLPLPSSALRTHYGVTYAPVNIGAPLAGQVQQFSATKPAADQNQVNAFANRVSSFTSSFLEAGADVIKGLRDGGLQKFEEGAINLASVLAFGDQDAARESLFGLAGQRYNPFTENLFKDVNFREHEFNYMFRPRSVRESQQVDEIIRLMRFFMLPAFGATDGVLGQIGRMAGGGVNGAVLNFPYEFQILYSVFDTTFMLLPSVLSDMDVDYSGGTDSPQFITGRGATPSGKNYPACITVRMKFREMMFLTRNRAEVDSRVAIDDTSGDNRADGNYKRFRF